MRLHSLAASAVIACVVSTAAAQTIWHVDASRPTGGNGLAWSSAFADLQSALSASSAGDQIWVARGVYKPTLMASPPDPRSANFVIPDGRALYGGFAGNETSLAARARLFAATVLDGDIGAPGVAADNSYHVVKMVGAATFTFATIDGFTIRNGNGVVAGSSYSQGAGIFASAAGATHGPALSVHNCIVRGNVADTGGGIAAANLARISLDSCTVRDNFATQNGGGMLCLTSYATSYNTLWMHNSTPGDGGAIYSNSTALDWVGFVNDVFRDNSANRGGAIGIAGSQFVRGSVVLECSTLAYNAAQLGGAIFAETSTVAKAQLQMQNTIVWSNAAVSSPSIVGSGSTIDVRYSDVEAGFAGLGNLNANPLFVDGPRRDFHLQHGSPACDAGNDALAPSDYFDFDHDGVLNEFVPHDFDHTRRFTDDPLAPDVGVAYGTLAVIDMGAFEN